MLASDLIKRARSLSDTPNSQFISHDDEINSLFESYKDIYSKLTDSSDDYYIQEVILDTSTAVQLGINEWELTIPEDVYKLRFVDYYDSGRWVSMNKFNTNNRNRMVSTAQYRWRGAKLWIIGSPFVALPSSIRIDYYPPPVKPSVPKASIQYGIAYPPYTANLVQSPNYFSVPNANSDDETDYLIYIYNAATIMLESKTLDVTRTLYTSTGLSNVRYYLGYVYYLKGGDIFRASTDLSATLVPGSAILNPGTITSFEIAGGKLIYSNGTDTVQATLDGTGGATLYAYPSKGAAIIGPALYFIKLADGLIYKNGAATTIAATRLSGDETYVYYLDSLGILHKYTDTTDEPIAQNVTYNGLPQNDYIGILTSTLKIQALSTLSDTDFTYPVNEANEIMAYQSAIDYKRKQNGDTSALSARLAEIIDRFMDVIKRDEYQPERRAAETPYWNY